MSELLWVGNFPWPPSISNYYMNARRGKFMGRVIGPEGVAFRDTVGVLVRVGHRSPPRLAGRLSVTVRAEPPSHRKDGRKDGGKKDLDNVWKCLLDSMTKAGVWVDDSQIDERHIWRAPLPQTPGRVWVEVHPFVGVPRYLKGV